MAQPVKRLYGTIQRPQPNEAAGKPSRKKPRCGLMAPKTLRTSQKKIPLPWTVIYRPKTLDDLTIPVKKLEAIRTVLQTANLAVVKGPPGSGKFSAVSLLAKDLGYTMCEWDTPAYRTQLSSLSQTFCSFLLSRGQPLSFQELKPNCTVDSAHTSSPLVETKTCASGSLSRHVLVIKDVPYTLFGEGFESPCVPPHLRDSRRPIVSPSVERALLSLMCAPMLRHMVVMILGDTASDYRIEQHLAALATLAQKERNRNVTAYQLIRVAAPSHTALRKVAKNILVSEGGLKPSVTLKGMDQAVSQYFNENPLDKATDVSGLLNILQLYVAPRLRDASQLGAPQSHSKTKTHCGFSDPQGDVMHAVGRLLWNKRLDAEANNIAFENDGNHRSIPRQPETALGEPQKDYDPISISFYQKHYTHLLTKRSWRAHNQNSDTTSSSAPAQRSPALMLRPRLLRPPLYFDVNALLDSLLCELPVVVDLLYSNYPFYFGSIHDAARLMDQLVYTDSFLRYNRRGSLAVEADDGSRWAICCRAALDANCHPTSPFTMHKSTKKYLGDTGTPSTAYEEGNASKGVPHPTKTDTPSRSWTGEEQHILGRTKVSTTDSCTHPGNTGTDLRSGRCFGFQFRKLWSNPHHYDSEIRAFVRHVFFKFEGKMEASSSFDDPSVAFCPWTRSAILEHLVWIPRMGRAPAKMHPFPPFFLRQAPPGTIVADTGSEILQSCQKKSWAESLKFDTNQIATERRTSVSFDIYQSESLEIDEAELEPVVDDDIENIPF